MKDGQMEYDDQGGRCYWDAENEGWEYTERFCSPRFLALLKKLYKTTDLFD